VYRSEQEPTWQVPLWTLVQDPHTDAPDGMTMSGT